MEIAEKLKQVGKRILDLKDQIQTEEATKTTSVMPFIQALGYDVFNPTEVVPEFISDIGTKKGEKIDYALFKDGKPIILIECKHLNQQLDIHDGQLLRYFHVSRAKFAILTNGIKYRFYTDLERENIMDTKPFLEFDITDLKDSTIEEISKFQKHCFDVGDILVSASDLKYLNAIKNEITAELSSPSEDFIRFFARKVYEGTLTSKVLSRFSPLTTRAIESYLNDKVTSRLKSALEAETESHEDNIEKTVVAKVDTTEEELNGFYVVKSICRKYVDSGRIHYRDAQTYFAILLDDNNRKTICRLYFNGKKKQIMV